MPDITISAMQNPICAGGIDILSASNSEAGGTSWAWSTSETTDSITIILPATTTYTVTGTNSYGCVNSTTYTVTVNYPPPTPTIVALTADSTTFVVSHSGITANYWWTLSDFGTMYYGSGDSAHLPVYPRNGTLTYYASYPSLPTATSPPCISSASVNIYNNYVSNYTISSSLLPYPRWSKRGMYLENLYLYVNNSDSITHLVDFCRRNHITYVNLDGTSWYGGFNVFSQDSAYYEPTNAVILENFIDSLKTRGGVEQVGTIVYQDTSKTYRPYILDSNAAAVEVFNAQNFSNSVKIHNWALPWEKKIDYLSIDAEFWGTSNYLHLFHTWFMPMLKAMSEAAHECPNENLRVEAFIGQPMNYYNTSFNVTDANQIMMADSIALYTDRILNANYTQYQNVTYNEADFILTYPNFGNHINGGRKMEIWPTFSAENYSAPCTKFYYYPFDDFSGYSLCYANKIDTAEWIEQLYYDSLAYSEKINKFTDVGTSYTQFAMGADTNFQILGSAWFDYAAVRTEHILFDTLTSGIHKGYLDFYVTLPHDTQVIGEPHWPWHPIVIRAKVHGGIPSYNYIFRNMDDNSVIQSSNYDTLAITFSPNFPSRISVEAVDGNDSTAIDYTCIYFACEPRYLHSPVRPPKPKAIKAITEGSAKVYPNPNKGTFKISLQNVNENTRVEIYNSMGQKILSETLLPAEENTVSLINHQSGIYFYRIIKENGNLIKAGKVVIEQ